MLMQKILKIDIFNTWPFQNFAPQYIYIALLFFCFFLKLLGFSSHPVSAVDFLELSVYLYTDLVQIHLLHFS